MRARKTKNILLVLFLVIIATVLGMLFITGVSGNPGKQISKAPTHDAAIDQPAGTDEDANIAGDVQPPLEEPRSEPEASEPEANEPASGDDRPAQQPPANSGAFVPPRQGYWLEVSVGEQKLRIYRDGSLAKEWLVSTGTPDKPTPLGVFKVQNRGEWFYSSKYKQGGKWWVSFKDWGVYLFHSVPMDQEQKIIPEESAKLGQPASHGCVRLEVENARWIYENIPQGTPVYIHK